MGRVLAYIAAGASLAQALQLENAPIVLRVIVTSVLAVIICVFSEGVGRAIGYSDAASMFKHLSPMMHGVGLALSPAVALGSAIDRLLLTIIPSQRANETERETSTEQFREVVAAEADVSSAEEELIHGVFSLGETEVKEIMEPRVDIVASTPPRRGRRCSTACEAPSTRAFRCFATRSMK
jgi:CBS domain containing-hemolysin-like protein